MLILSVFILIAAQTASAQNGTGSSDAVTITVTATVQSIIETITIQTIDFDGADRDGTIVTIDPVESPLAGKIVTRGTPGSEFRLEYLEERLMPNTQGNGTLSFLYNLAGNARTTSSYRTTRTASTFTQGVRGSVGYDSNNNSTIRTNRDQVGRSGGLDLGFNALNSLYWLRSAEKFPASDAGQIIELMEELRAADPTSQYAVIGKCFEEEQFIEHSWVRYLIPVLSDVPSESKLVEPTGLSLFRSDDGDLFAGSFNSYRLPRMLKAA